MLSSVFSTYSTSISIRCLRLVFLALHYVIINFQSQKLHTSALVFIIRLISQEITGIFKSRNTILKVEHSSSSSPNSMRMDEISAENKAHHTLADFLSGDSRFFIADKTVWFLGSSQTCRFFVADLLLRHARSNFTRER